MRAAVMTAYREPLEIRDVADPRPGDHDAVIRVEACGICRSDWHLWQEDWSWVGVSVPLPRVPGHEFGGTVVDVGKNVKRSSVGDRVTIPFHLACGQCEFCSTGRSNICQAFGFLGAHTDGGYGELACIPQADANLVRLPAGVTPAVAAAGDEAVAGIRELTGGGAHLAVDALGSSATAVPGILSLRKGGRHLFLGGTGKEDNGIIGIPVDAMRFQELSFLASLGCPTTSYPGLLSMVASGALQPERLVESTVDVGDVNSVLTRMTDFRTTGFNVITSWTAAPANA